MRKRRVTNDGMVGKHSRGGPRSGLRGLGNAHPFTDEGAFDPAFATSPSMHSVPSLDAAAGGAVLGTLAVANELAGAAQTTEEAHLGRGSRPLAAVEPSHSWSYDFVFDHRAITAENTFSKEGLATNIEVPRRVPVSRLKTPMARKKCKSRYSWYLL
jgi:hypothetical protein